MGRVNILYLEMFCGIDEQSFRNQFENHLIFEI